MNLKRCCYCGKVDEKANMWPSGKHGHSHPKCESEENERSKRRALQIEEKGVRVDIRPVAELTKGQMALVKESLKDRSFKVWVLKDKAGERDHWQGLNEYKEEKPHEWNVGQKLCVKYGTWQIELLVTFVQIIRK